MPLEKIAQIKRLAKLNEGIEKEINAENALISRLLLSIHRFKGDTYCSASPFLRIKREKEIKQLMTEIKRCDFRIQLLRRKLASNQRLCNDMLLCISPSFEAFGKIDLMDRGTFNSLFDWKSILGHQN
ncbi:hypothetical protein [Lunatimonas salinarum]|uniref:hypothetical protein n=1 Tax=Lunatimonas salinarum TaxID=1774590 RepID=UPI001ADF290B|nr:hypothetical protein [Lunatimonas salinarum]